MDKQCPRSRMAASYAVIWLCCSHLVLGELTSYATVAEFRNFLKKIEDPEFNCHLGKAPSLALSNEEPIVRVADCDKRDSRLDYSLQYDSGKKVKRKQPITGKATLIFPHEGGGFNDADGLRSGVCFRPFSHALAQVKGSFANGVLHGTSRVDFHNDTFLVGEADEGRLVGQVRKFHTLFTKSKVIASLRGIYDGSHTWKIERMLDSHTVLRFENDTNLVIDTEGNALYRDCEQSGTQVLRRCKKVEEFRARQRGCVLDIDYIRQSTTTFSIRLLKDSIIVKDEGLSDNVCHAIVEKKLSPSESLKDWLSIMRNVNEDPFWARGRSKTPLASEAPHVRIRLPILKDRATFKNKRLALYGGDTRLITVSLNQGEISLNLTDSEKSPAWGNLMRVYPYSSIDSGTDGLPQVMNAMGEEVSVETPYALGRLSQGRFQGVVRMFGVMTLDPQSLCTARDKLSNDLLFVGTYSDQGLPSGPSWRGVHGNGWIHGRVDSEGDFTGDDIAYIYPDLELALLGTFKNGIMISAQKSEITGVRCNEDIMEPTFSDPTGPAFHYEPGTSESYGDQPFLTDPLEMKYVSLQDSSRGFGQGLIARRDIPEGTVIATYGGLVFTDEKLLKEKKPASDYRILVRGCSYIMDNFMPHEYNATLVHKINHSFKPNTKFFVSESPRYGPLIALMTLVPVTLGEELFVDYGYGFRPDLDKWYTDELKNHLGEEEFEKRKEKTPRREGKPSGINSESL